MAMNNIDVVDADGHVMEDWDSLMEFMPEPYRKSGRLGTDLSSLDPPPFRQPSPASPGCLQASQCGRLDGIYERRRYRKGRSVHNGRPRLWQDHQQGLCHRRRQSL